ncbi:oxalate/formate MFS antiporter [Bradyrhizobium sp. dw_411]|uniref:oxalate/formate MFS antiporter n=1 Tax=Bradyrhizobium sp. dw_411 TaxID=2720082 RepID=UPI001BCE5A69|nr:oxalate/formate MFS antiporter [Bradyrhizobium sp. dw_411]
MSAQNLKSEQSAAMTRWWQLALAMIAMMAASSPQYVWALFVPPLQAKLGVTLSALQVTFALFSICQCGLGPMHGYFAEKFTPRQFAAMGGALVGASWILSSYVVELPWLYITYGVLSGIGTGMIYVATVELVSLWFPQRRGFAIGMVAGSYGFGAVITTFPIDASIRASGYQQTLLIYGLVLGIVSILVALGMRHPPIDPARQQREDLAETKFAKRNYTSAEMLRTPIFWLMFVMMSMMATGGLMVISQIGAFARDFGIGKDTLVLGMAALPLALTIDRVANGLTRPFFGWVSDRIGREHTMTVAFLLEGVAILFMLIFGRNPVWFVMLSGFIFFGWGEIYSLFPAIQGDLFGQKHAANNFGFLLVATAVGSILGGPLAALLFEQSHSWTLVFSIVSGLDILTAILALVVLKPMRRRFLEGDALQSDLAASLL